jgi:membrane protein implicated in regulation of membrane protease activity
MFDFIPPLPSLWAVLVLAIGFFLYRSNRPVLGIGVGVVGVLMMAGWLFSLLGWAISFVFTLAVVAAVLGGVYWLLKGRKGRSKKKSKTDHLSKGSRAPDIDALIAQAERETADIRRKTI